MNPELIASIGRMGVFHPRQRFMQLAQDHVPLDELIGSPVYEAKALAAITTQEVVVGIVGGRGAGKSSLIAAICTDLPESHVALRVPVAGADDPTSLSVIAAVTLSQALHDVEMAEYQRKALERARADGETAERSSGSKGGTLGGGAIPVALHAELETLRVQYATNRLAADRLVGLDRLIDIFVAQNRRPVFVLEDTEAAIGGADDPARAEAFLNGPVHAFIHEIDAASIIAIQNVFAANPAFGELAPSMLLIDLPALKNSEAREALIAIIENRLSQYDHPIAAAEMIADQALEELAEFYERTRGNLRLTLAALQTAAEYAAESSAPSIGVGHMRAAIGDWVTRLSVAAPA